MSRWLKAAAFGVAAVLSTAGATARAEYLSGATGFTTLRDRTTSGIVKGIINFAVLDRRAGSFGDTWGTGFDYFDRRFVRGVDAMGDRGPRLDYEARYLYLYQVTNDDDSYPIESSAVRIVIPTRYITSWGHFKDLGFADDDYMTGTRAAVSATNPFGLLDPDAAPGDISLSVNYPAVVDIAGGDDPGRNPHEVLLTAQAVRSSWLGTTLVLPGGRGTIFGFTSDYPPGFIDGTVVRQCGREGQPPCP